MKEIIVRLIELPCRVRGFTAPDEDGNYNIYINSKLCFADQKRAYRHELHHIQNGDIESPDACSSLEKEGHEKTPAR